MKLSIFCLLFGILGMLVLAAPKKVMAYCAYGSTQARVQKDITQPWAQHISVKQNESFRVGGFHDQTGQFASDTQLRVYGPTLNGQVFANAGVIGALQPGTYTLWVTTSGQSGGGCEEMATVTVEPVAVCPYTSTQARVQKDITKPWKKEITIKQHKYFNAGSFHNATGQFANDTTITMTSPTGVTWVTTNGQPIPAWEKGSFKVKVTTNGYTGKACTASANVRVR